jgi:hypothetical protein
MNISYLQLFNADGLVNRRRRFGVQNIIALRCTIKQSLLRDDAFSWQVLIRSTRRVCDGGRHVRPPDGGRAVLDVRAAAPRRPRSIVAESREPPPVPMFPHAATELPAAAAHALLVLDRRLGVVLRRAPDLIAVIRVGLQRRIAAGVLQGVRICATPVRSQSISVSRHAGSAISFAAVTSAISYRCRSLRSWNRRFNGSDQMKASLSRIGAAHGKRKAVDAV